MCIGAYAYHAYIIYKVFLLQVIYPVYNTLHKGAKCWRHPVLLRLMFSFVFVLCCEINEERMWKIGKGKRKEYVLLTKEADLFKLGLVITLMPLIIK